MTSSLPTTRHLPYIPALDGLRGLAIAAVLLFHHGYAWAGGGFLGVSLFFTLSGFLITTLLLREFEATGTVRLDAFFGRRMRRLLPPALLTIVAVWLAGALGVWGISGLRADLVSAALYVANWRFLFDSASYQALFEDPSPVLHFWSLAIEEQFYLLIAPAVLLGLRWRRGRWLMTGVAVAAGVSLAATAAAAAAGNDDFVYYSSITRAFELLTGVTVALLWAGLSTQRRQLLGRAGAAGGAPALVAVVAAMALVDRSDGFLYSGLLPVFAVASAVLVLACVTPTPVQRLLALRPLAALGRVSYALYLFHWPVFLVLTPARTGVSGSTLFGAHTVVAVALAVGSQQLLEQRIRFKWRRSERTAVAWGSVLTAAVAAVVAANVLAAPAQPTFAALKRDLDEQAEPSDIRTYGDSTAIMTTIGLRSWSNDTGAASVSSGVVEIGCGLVAVGEYKYGPDPARPVPERCDWRRRWAADADRARPAVAVIQVGPFDVADRRLPGDDVWRHPGDPLHDDYLRRQIADATDLFASRGAQVVWLTSPKVELGRLEEDPSERPYATSEPARMKRLNELIYEETAGRPDVTVVDLAAYLASLPGGELDARLRPDGVHFTEETAAEVAEWLGPAIVAATSADTSPS